MALTKVPSNLDATIATTQSQADNSTNIATTAYVDLAISNLSDSAPAALNTLNEIAAALGDDANYAATTTAAIADKLPLSGGTMTGQLNTGHVKLTGTGTDNDSHTLYFTNGAAAIARDNNDLELHAYNAMIFGVSNTSYPTSTERMRIDSSGNVGIGVTPSTIWSSSYDALQIGIGGSISAHSSAGDALKIGSNFVYEGTAPNYYDKYLTTSAAHKYELDVDGHKWFYAASGTAGNAISWSEAMRINSSGNVGIGNTNPQHKIHFGEGGGYYTSIGSGNSVPGGATPWLGLFNNTSIASATYGWGVYDSSADGSLQIWNRNSSATGAVALTIKRGGNVGIGTDSPVNAKLEIESSTDQGLLLHLKNTDQDSNTYMRYKDWAGQYWDTGINWANNDYYFNYGGAFKARFTNAGGLQIDGSGSDTTPTLALNSTTSTTFNHSINAFNANLAGSENQLIVVGKEGSTKNSGYIGYKWIASGNNGNMLTFGHWGNDNIMNLTADGKLGIGTQGPIAPLDVSGAVSSIIAMTSAHAYSQNRNWRFVSNNFGSGNWGGFSLERSTGAGGTPSVPVWGIDINGYTGIGIGGSAGATQAAAKLHVYGGVGAVIRGENTHGYMSFGSSNSSYAHHQTDRGTYYFPVPCQASGGFSTYSDSRLKENIEPVTGALDKVAIMNGVTFTWDNSEKTYGPEGKQFGVLAQNMLEVDSDLPSLKEDALELQENIDNPDIDTQYYTMDYSRLTPFFIEAIKELKTKLEAAEARIAVLEG